MAVIMVTENIIKKGVRSSQLKINLKSSAATQHNINIIKFEYTGEFYE